MPHGTSIEIINLSALQLSHKLGRKKHKSEYSTLYINENPDKFKILRLKPPKPLQRVKIRLTVDTPEDLIVMRKIYTALSVKQKLISIKRIIEYMDKHPEIKKINSNIPVKHKIY